MKKKTKHTKMKKSKKFKKSHIEKGIKVEFCKKCDSIMLPLKKGSSTIFKCRSCNYQTKKNVKNIKIVKDEPTKRNEVIILEKNTIMLPVTEQVCPSCEHKKAYWWMQQTRASDEPPTQFFRCVKCNHVWREYK